MTAFCRGFSHLEYRNVAGQRLSTAGHRQRTLHDPLLLVATVPFTESETAAAIGWGLPSGVASTSTGSTPQLPHGKAIKWVPTIAAIEVGQWSGFDPEPAGRE
jgi:hypothetical protein